MTTAKRARGAALAAAVLALAACTDWAMYDVDVAAGKVPALATMRKDVIPDRYGMPRSPAEGSVPVVHPLGDVPGPYTQTQLDSIAPSLSNPLPASPEVLARGKRQYETSCAVCHGAAGDGRGTVIAQNKFPYAPPLGAGSPTTGRSDGYIYAVIDKGRGLMPPYGHRMTHLDRWAVVAYVRQLQGTAGPAPVPPTIDATTPAPSADTAAPPALQPADAVPGDTGSSTQN